MIFFERIGRLIEQLGLISRGDESELFFINKQKMFCDTANCLKVEKTHEFKSNLKARIGAFRNSV